ncbi:MAG: ATP phosphoribosyltransferase regulatory subunit [Chloroflexi bacterium]|nr:ATP phosphoribosyltransferase regulatory subunit [Chloroflexota bacterium]
MSARGAVERIKGTNDIAGEQHRLRRFLRDTLARCYESYGYEGVEVPVLEHTELFSRKSGSDVVAKLYSFTDQSGRQVSLRPEFTASVIRLFVERGQSLPLPLRWYYEGPVFRYERPQRSRYRQFTQQGVELIGGSGPPADAEVLLLACRALQALGLERFRVVVGHVGVILQFLEHLRLSERVRTFLLSSLEDLSKRSKGTENVKLRLSELGLLGSEELDPELKSLLGLLDEGQARLVVRGLLSSMNLEFGGSRDPEEIVDRFMKKLRGSDQAERIGTALDFIARLARIKGSPASAFAKARALTAQFDLDPSSLEALRTAVDLVVECLGDESKVEVDFGLARGLAYYTGMVFEIHHADLPAGLQVCGGGRYDGLARATGAREDVPALGFAFGLERLAEALAAEKRTPFQGRTPATDTLVIAADASLQGRALQVAESLRRDGKVVEVDARGRSVKSNLGYANRRGIRRVVIVSDNGSEPGLYLVKDMATGEEKHVAICPA